MPLGRRDTDPARGTPTPPRQVGIAGSVVTIPQLLQAGVGKKSGAFRPAHGIRDRSPSRGLGDVYKRQKSLRAQPGGKVLITDGPYLETKEHIGGFLSLIHI